MSNIIVNVNFKPTPCLFSCLDDAIAFIIAANKMKGCEYTEVMNSDRLNGLLIVDRLPGVTLCFDDKQAIKYAVVTDDRLCHFNNYQAALICFEQKGARS